MTIQETREFFASTDFSPETKQKITEALREKSELDPMTVLLIKEIMQEELEKDFVEAGVHTLNDPHAEAIEKEYADGLDTIEKEMKDDMAFVETELDELEKVRKDVMQVSDEVDAKAVRDSI